MRGPFRGGKWLARLTTWAGDIMSTTVRNLSIPDARSEYPGTSYVDCKSSATMKRQLQAGRRQVHLYLNRDAITKLRRLPGFDISIGRPAGAMPDASNTLGEDGQDSAIKDKGTKFSPFIQKSKAPWSFISTAAAWIQLSSRTKSPNSPPTKLYKLGKTG